MHFMLPGMDGLARLPQSEDDADAFKARLDAIKVRAARFRCRAAIC